MPFICERLTHAMLSLRFGMQHYISFHTYAFFGFMHNEFDGVDQWQVSAQC